MPARPGQPPSPPPDRADEIHALAEALRQIAKDWSRHDDKLHPAGLALANLREAVLLGAFPGARFAELRLLITEDGPRRLRRRLRIETTELPGVVIAGWLQRKRMMPAWFDLPSFLWEPAVYDVLADLLDAEAAPPPAKPAAAAAAAAAPSAGGGTTWQDAARRAEDHLRRNPFPGVKTLARIVGCSPATMVKAIRRSTVLLAHQRNAEGPAPRGGPRTVPLTEGHVRRSASRPDVAIAPEAAADLDDRTVAALLESVLEGADAAARVQYERMSVDERRRFAQLLAAHPDLAPVRERSRRKPRR